MDGHAIPTVSDDNDLSPAGFKTKAYPGYILDKKDFAADLGSLEGKVILVDRGFSDEENLRHIATYGGFYVIPVCPNRREYKEIAKPRKGKTASFLHHRGSKVDVVAYRKTEVGARSIIFYRNSSETERLSSLYLQAMENGIGFQASKKGALGLDVLSEAYRQRE